MELSPEVKAQLIADIEKGDEAALRGMMETLRICLGDSDPNAIYVSLSFEQMKYLEKWQQTFNGILDEAGTLRMILDVLKSKIPDPVATTRDAMAKQLATQMGKGAR